MVAPVKSVVGILFRPLRPVARGEISGDWTPPVLVNVVERPKEPFASKVASKAGPRRSYTTPRPPRIVVLSPSPNREWNKPELALGDQANARRGPKSL